MPSQYSPPGETAGDLFLERSNLDGLLLAGPFYGILFTLALQCITSLWTSREHRKNAIPLILYTVAIFILASVGYGSNAKFVEMTYIDFRNYPGGPNAFTSDFYSDWVNMMGFASYVVLGWLADGLVLYRFALLYNFNYWVITIPGLMYLGVVGSSVAVITSTCITGLWSYTTFEVGITYFSLSVSLNIIITTLICGRILMVRNAVTSTLGSELSKTYVSVMAMLIESASLYTTWFLLFMIPYIKNSAVQNIFMPGIGHVQGIAALLILHRVARGKAWTQDTLTLTTTTLPFETCSQPNNSVLQNHRTQGEILLDPFETSTNFLYTVDVSCFGLQEVVTT